MRRARELENLPVDDIGVFEMQEVPGACNHLDARTRSGKHASTSSINLIPLAT